MKKLFAILLSAMLLMMISAPALAEDGLLCGGWAATADATVTDEIRAVFDKAIEGMTGSLLEPVAVLGTQVVAGTNYCILCRSTPVVPDPLPAYVLVYLYDGVDGSAEILGIDDVEIELPDRDN